MPLLGYYHLRDSRVIAREKKEKRERLGRIQTKN